MTLKETRDGGVFAHILIVLYVFGALAIVCDDYFCASLEIICDGKRPVGQITFFLNSVVTIYYVYSICLIKGSCLCVYMQWF